MLVSQECYEWIDKRTKVAGNIAPPYDTFLEKILHDQAKRGVVEKTVYSSPAERD